MKHNSQRFGFTLLEVLIASALTTVIAGLMGGLMRWYVVNQTRADNTFEELRLARTILGMIADDLRCVVRNEPVDMSPLVTLMQGSAGGQAAAALSALGQSGAGGSNPSAAMAGAANGAANMAASSDSANAAESQPQLPGIIGSAVLLEVDISRPPRVDETIMQTPDLMAGTLNDLPTDLKTVTYYVQGNQMNGVADSLSALSSDVLNRNNSTLSSSGLVRRMIARNVLQQAYIDGDTDRILRTGTLICQEVVGLRFEYFDGTQWVTAWDSSTQGIPIVVRVSIAMQNPSAPPESRLPVPIDMSMTNAASLAESGVTVYSTIVTIPGAALATKPESTDDGSSELGL